jgi:hypothetical protein
LQTGRFNPQKEGLEGQRAMKSQTSRDVEIDLPGQFNQSETKLKDKMALSGRQI